MCTHFKVTIVTRLGAKCCCKVNFLAILQATVCGELEEDAGIESSDQGGDEDEDNCDQDGGVGDYDVVAGFTAMFFLSLVSVCLSLTFYPAVQVLLSSASALLVMIV